MHRSSSSCFLAVTLTLALGASTARADEKISPTARAQFEAGVALLQDPDGARYEEAHRAFTAAYEASKSPRVLGNIGLCAMKLERDVEAIDAYTRYLDEVQDVDPIEREQIKRDLATMKSGLVHIDITVAPAGAKIVDVRSPARGQAVSNVYLVSGDRLTIGVRAGHHVIHAQIGDRISPIVELDAQPGQTYERALTVPPPVVPKPNPSRTGPLLTLGLGLTSLAAGGVFAYLSTKKVDEIEGKCPGGECPSDYDLEGAQRRTRPFTTATDALLIGGGAVTLVGLTWLLLQGSGSREGEKPRPTQANAMCTGGGCFATFGGRF